MDKLPLKHKFRTNSYNFHSIFCPCVLLDVFARLSHCIIVVFQALNAKQHDEGRQSELQEEFDTNLSKLESLKASLGGGGGRGLAIHAVLLKPSQQRRKSRARADR